MHAVPRKSLFFVSAALVVSMLASGLGPAEAQVEWSGEDKTPSTARAEVPEDRYAMAGGCYVLSTEAGYVTRNEDGFSASAATEEAAAPFFFQATDLGQYLLFGSDESYLAASEGALAEATYAATDSLPGQIAGGVALEQTDVAADAVADSEANRAAGRGASIEAATEPSELVDWVVRRSSDGSFTFELPATDQVLVVDSAGTLGLADSGATGLAIELANGCAEFPEVDVNVSGPIMGGQTSFQEVRGFMDLHLHGMAFEFLGGRARCARPWSPYGVTEALVDCPDHHPGGEGAVLERVLSGDYMGRHDPDGWPSFVGWPRANYLTHEQLYYKWLERAWRGGLRMYTNLLVDNAALCKLYPFKDRHQLENQCNEMDGVRLQHQRILELERYIDAQSGGPGEGWFRIVTDPFQAREVMNDGKLAVVLGIEVSSLFDCFIRPGEPECTQEQIDEGLQEVWDMGVRQMELVNKFDNGLSGVTGDGGPVGVVVNQGNKSETGSYWKMETCPEHAGHAHDKAQMNPADVPGSGSFIGRDSLVAQVLSLAGTSGAAPVYPPAPHCNVLGLSALGEHVIRQMADKGMIFDPDHMSARARTEAMDLIDELSYSGVVSSHSWADETIYPRIYQAGGVVTPSDSNLAGFLKDYDDSKGWADDRFLFGFGYGSDVNGFSSSAGPIGGETTVTYPFTGFGGAIVDQQQSGTMTYDVNTDGVAHYGLYTDWIQGLFQLGGDEFYKDMTLGPEAYLQMWERAVGIPGDACRWDVADLTPAQIGAVAPGTSYEEVLRQLGQPSSRVGNQFTYCVEGGVTGVITFDDDGRVAGGTDPEPEPEPKPCPSKRPVASKNGNSPPRDNEVPGKACGRG